MNSVVTPARRWLWVGSVLLLGIVASVLGFTTISPVRAQAGLISGAVTDPAGGLPPAGSQVLLRSPDGDVHGQAVVDAGTGDFTLGPVANGNYILQAAPPAASSLTPSLPQGLAVTGQPVTVGSLALTTPAIEGVVFAPDGTTAIDARVRVTRGGELVQVAPAPGGEIAIGGLLTGTYRLQAEPGGDPPFWMSPSLPVTVTPGVSQTVSLTLRPANVAGVITDPQGVPIPGARVHVFGLIHHVVRQDVTGAGGAFAIGDLRPDVYVLVAEPPWLADGLVPSAAVEFTVPPAFTDLGQIALRQAPKIVSGQVTTNAGEPVAQALVIATRLNLPGQQRSLTDSDGRYALRLGGGLWSLTVQHTDLSQPSRWVYAEPPRLVYFPHTLEPEQKTVNFAVLTADAEVTGVVEMPDGSPPPFTVTVSLRNSEGIGRHVVADPVDGRFTIPVPHGPYVLTIMPANAAYFGPPPQAVGLTTGQTLDVGSQTLLEKDATLKGRVVDASGQGVAGIRVTAWTREHLAAQTRTGPDGRYVLPVIAGEWLVRPHVPAALPYVYSGGPQQAVLQSGQHLLLADFVLTAANNVIIGQLVNPQGDAVQAQGWAWAAGAPGTGNGAPIVEGAFAINVPDGSFRVGVQLAPGSDWLAGPPQEVALAGGQTATLTVPVRPQNATILGALWDPRAGLVVEGVNGHVMAASPWTAVGDDIDPANGTYRLDVAAGLWHLSYGVNPLSGYVPLSHHQVVPLEADQTLVAPLPVAPRDAALAGTVVDPAGQPVAGAPVVADGMGGQVSQVTLRTVADADGRFRLPVPHGSYRLWAAGGDSGWLNPVVAQVTARPGQVVAGLVLQFRQPDVTLSGQVSLANRGVMDGRIHIWAYSADGAATYTAALPGEAYSLALLSHTTWHLGAVYETPDAFYAVRQAVAMGGADQTLDLVLDGPLPKPAPVVVTFDAAEAQRVQLADGTAIFIPAGAMPVTGDVTLYITPIATFPHQHHARLYKYGYAFVATDGAGRPITSRFNQNVVIQFAYDEADLAAWHLVESRLKPAYYSTTTRSWTIPESYVVDTAADQVVMQIDHFTDFSLLNGPGFDVYLPLIQR